MNRKENVLILFDGPHLAYSPTTVQLYDELSKVYAVTVIAQDPGNYNGQELNGYNVIYHKYYQVKGRYFYKILFALLAYFNKEVKYFKNNSLNYRDYFFRFLFIKKFFKSRQFKTVICVDISNLFVCSLLGIKVDFLSLELCKDEQLLKKINLDIIKSVIIQSAERYNYLFPDKKFQTFYVQNAPYFKEIEIKAERKCLIYAGGAYDVLGFYHCLDYLRQYKQETLVVQGAIFEIDRNRVNTEYADLLNEKRLVINSGYIENDAMVEYISNYEIGFCFYDFDNPFIKANYFNYASAPSGKMFKYLAAGVPVVASNIIGFKFVEQFNCGVLINGLAAAEIEKAVLTIRENYDFYVQNAITAAKHYSFDKAIAPYLEFISSR